MQKIIVLLALVAIVLSQTPQDGPLSVTYLTSGTTYSGTILPSTEDRNYDVQIFAIWVPENATLVNLTFTNNDDTSCDWISFGGNSEVFPCAIQGGVYDSSFACYNGQDFDNGVGDSYNTVLNAGDASGLYYFAGNKYLYLSAGRYSDYNTETCTFGITATVESGCAQGQVAYDFDNNDDDDAACLTYTNVVQGTQYPVTNANITLFKTVLSQSTGNFIITVNSTSDEGEIYGASFAAPSNSNYKCYTSSPVTAGTFYIYTLNCYTPKAGDFFFTYADDAPYTASVSVQVLNCSTNGGANCTSPLTQFNSSEATVSVSVSVPNMGGSDEGYVYYYINTDNSTNTIVITAQSDNAEYLIIRRDAFPEEDSRSGYESSSQYQTFPATFSINNFDFAVAGRIYIGASCDDTNPGPCTVNFTISSTAANLTSSSGGATTGAGGSGSTTGNGASGATTGIFTTGIPVTTAAPVATTGITTESTTEQASSVSVLVPSMIVAAIAYFF